MTLKRPLHYHNYNNYYFSYQPTLKGTFNTAMKFIISVIICTYR